MTAEIPASAGSLVGRVIRPGAGGLRLPRSSPRRLLLSGVATLLAISLGGALVLAVMIIDAQSRSIHQLQVQLRSLQAQVDARLDGDRVQGRALRLHDLH